MAQYKIIVDTKGSTKKEKEKEQLANATGTNSSDSKEEQVNKLLNKETVNIITTIADTGISAANAYVSTIGVRTDNQARQNEINNIINSAGFITKQIGSTANSIAVGSAIGGAAGTVTAVVAISAQVINETMNIINNIKEYNREITNDALDSVHNGERIGRISTDNNR